MEWIKFSDTFPPKKLECVLVFEISEHINGNMVPIICIESVDEIYMINSHTASSYSGGENLTHWMPLPESPKD